ncbi:MAG TPA: putative Ig domain-containing protein [Armatimonadota bacterium]|nr:putative Ig domain-containing protein [Armatimonadota bacterium]
MSVEIDCATLLAPADPWDAGSPVINGPAIYGASPNTDFLYLIPTVGERPIHFTADGLPEGLHLDSASGQIRGRSMASGEYRVLLRAENRLGKAEKPITLVIADHALALTPPMGWNSWNCFRSDIDADKIARIAEGLITSGLAARGYSYVNLDSGWQSKKRGGQFNAIIPHDGFPDMAELCGKIHALGLKMGIYSGPYVVPWGTEGCGTTSGRIDTNFPCFAERNGKYIGLEKHEAEDVAQWAAWGIDYCKYDWAHTDMVLAGRMSEALRRSSRDIVFSVTTSVKLEDAREVARLCNLWRSNDDTQPTWNSVVRNGFGNEPWNPYIGPGHWFDLDMTAILPREDNQLTRNELIAYYSCWAMRPSPLMIDCVPDEMDAFTQSLLCNEEVIAVNQDALGKPSAVVAKNDGFEIQLKPLADGSYAVGIFNLSEEPGMSPELDFARFGLPGELHIRDLWAKRDLEGRWTKLAVAVDAHCAKLFRAIP